MRKVATRLSKNFKVIIQVRMMDKTRKIKRPNCKRKMRRRRFLESLILECKTSFWKLTRRTRDITVSSQKKIRSSKQVRAMRKRANLRIARPSN
jgi:hypothetical protein